MSDEPVVAEKTWEPLREADGYDVRGYRRWLRETGRLVEFERRRESIRVRLVSESMYSIPRAGVASFWEALRYFVPGDMGELEKYRIPGRVNPPEPEEADAAVVTDEPEESRTQRYSGQDWHWDISPREAERLCFELKGRESDRLTELAWAADNLSNRKASPLQAPTNQAWELLRLAKDQPAKFWSLHAAGMAKQVVSETDRVMEDDGRRIFGVYEKLKVAVTESA